MIVLKFILGVVSIFLAWAITYGVGWLIAKKDIKESGEKDYLGVSLLGLIMIAISFLGIMVIQLVGTLIFNLIGNINIDLI